MGLFWKKNIRILFEYAKSNVGEVCESNDQAVQAVRMYILLKYNNLSVVFIFSFVYDFHIKLEDVSI
jgi:hypothetical protein